jgi:aryl-alcohol dehydrogenase-like predicted oxidoreductase
MMHQGARQALLPRTRDKRIGTLAMFVVRSIFTRSERVVAALRVAAAKGEVETALGESAAPLDFLLHPGGAADITEAAYRFARHQGGIDVVLFGTSDPTHLRTNVASLLKPPLPQADRDRLAALFGHLTSVGMDSAPMQTK